jgi:AraC-like DNA-binding protein
MDSRSSAVTIERILTFIDAHFDKPIGPRNVAAAMNYSRGHLTHVTRKTLGCSVGELILRRRIDAACHMLEDSLAPVTWIAARVGFSDVAYFSRRFSQQMGTSPSHWRKLHHIGDDSLRLCPACGRPLPLIAPPQYGTSEGSEAAS